MKVKFSNYCSFLFREYSQGCLQYRPGCAYPRAYTNATYSTGLGLSLPGSMPRPHTVQSWVAYTTDYTKATYSKALVCLLQGLCQGHLQYRPGSAYPRGCTKAMRLQNRPWSAYHRVLPRPPTVQAWDCLPQGLYQGRLQYRPGSAYHRVYTKTTYSTGLGLPTTGYIPTLKKINRSRLSLLRN